MACSHAAVLYAQQREVFMLLFIFHMVFGDASMQMIQEQRLTLFLYPYVSCYFGVFYSTKVIC